MQVGKKLPRGSIKLELKSLKLLSLQASLRAQVEKEQGDIMNMGERAYRKFARNCQASRSNFDRTVSFSCITLHEPVHSSWLCRLSKSRSYHSFSTEMADVLVDLDDDAIPCKALICLAIEDSPDHQILNI